MIGLVIAMLVVVGGGTSLAAQSALPGDLLYPVKVNVNEEVRAALSGSDKARAEFEAERAATRLEEAEELSVKEDVDSQTRADIEASFRDFADRVEARMEALVDADAKATADLASNFEVALVAHEKVLARLATRVDGEETSSLQVSVDKELKDTVELRLKAEKKVKEEDGAPATMEAARGKLGAAANVLVQVGRFIDLKESALGADAVVNARAELKKAQDLKAEADADFTAGKYPEAFNKGNAVIRMAQGAKLLIETQEELEVDLHLGGKPSVSPRRSPRVEGLMESEAHADGNGGSASGRVEIEFGF